MFRIGDKDVSGSVCKYVKGPIAIWEAPEGEYGIYLTVNDKDFMGTLYNHRRNYDEALLIADKTYEKLNKYGKNIFK
ncbi:hypothetical protein ACFLUU_08690 [Chloroflexota bacterium]